MGMKLWFELQISEHWPGRVEVRVAWLRHPGMASVFRPSDGTAHECSTSSDEISIRIGTSIGSTTRLSTSRSWSSPGFSSDVGIM
jgi:hypothetical protein